MPGARWELFLGILVGMFMKNHPFEPLLVFDSEVTPISSVEEALTLLLSKPNHDCAARIDAFEACISTLKRVVPAVVARDAFIDFTKLLHNHNLKPPSVRNELPGFGVE